MTRFFARNELAQFGAVVWEDTLSQWNPKKNDVYVHHVGIMKADGDNTYRAIKRHYPSDSYEIVSGEQTLDDAVSVLVKTFS